MHEYRESVADGFIELETLTRDEFLTLKETLTRIGMPMLSKDSTVKPTLWQTAFVFHSKARYYLVHFKQMFLLDGKVKSTNITDEDMQRLWSIAYLIKKWGLAKFKSEVPHSTMRVKVVPYHEKDDWNLRQKYDIGGKLSNHE